MKKQLYIAAALLLIPAAAHAETIATDDFVQKVIAGNRFEIESSKVAIARSDDRNVKNFAAQMIQDHTKAAAELGFALKKAEKLVPEDMMDAGHQNELGALTNADNVAFNAQYVKAQDAAHDETVTLFKDYIAGAEEGPVKDFATETLPALEHHQQMVKDLKVSDPS